MLPLKKYVSIFETNCNLTISWKNKNVTLFSESQSRIKIFHAIPRYICVSQIKIDFKGFLASAISCLQCRFAFAARLRALIELRLVAREKTKCFPHSDIGYRTRYSHCASLNVCTMRMHLFVCREIVPLIEALQSVRYRSALYRIALFAGEGFGETNDSHSEVCFEIVNLSTPMAPSGGLPRDYGTRFVERGTRPFHYRRDRFKSYHLRPLVNFRPFSEVYRRFLDLSRTSRSRPSLARSLNASEEFPVLRRGRVLRSATLPIR